MTLNFCVSAYDYTNATKFVKPKYTRLHIDILNTDIEKIYEQYFIPRAMCITMAADDKLYDVQLETAIKFQNLYKEEM